MPTVLIMAASPSDQDRLRLGNEVKQIKRSLERSTNREKWTIQSNEAATVDDLRRALLDFRPTVVHFSGHGGGASGLAFEDDNGLTHQAHSEPLAKLFHHFKDVLKCVVLNACYSEVQADLISQQIDFVVGMRDAVSDDAATKFSAAFYDAIFAGTTFRQAFDIGCTAIDLSNLDGCDVPMFIAGPSVGAVKLPYTELIPQFEDLLLTYMNTPFSDRYRLTTGGEKIKERTARHYGTALHTQFEKAVVCGTRQITDEVWYVRVGLHANGQAVAGNFFIRVRGRDMKIEWEASVGYWSMPVQAFLALGSINPIVARVAARLGTAYLGEFSDVRHRFQAVDLESASGDRIFGYVNKHTQEGLGLIQRLSDGNEHQLTLAIRSTGKPSVSDEAVILSMLSETWIFDDAKFIGQ